MTRESVGREALEYVEVGLFGLRTMVDVGLLVLGSALLGLALAVLADGLGLVELGLGLSTAGMLGSALVVGVVAAFAFGVSSEGRFGANRSFSAPPRMVAVGRAVGGLAVSGVLIWGGGRLADLTVELAYPLRLSAEIVRACGVGGVVASLVGAPAVWGARRGLDRIDWGPVLELPFLYAVWTLSTLLVLRLP